MTKKPGKFKDVTNEVDHLHPILKKLFPQLPNINNVDYTHGTREMGADFILEQFNSTLKQTEWVGVIAKVGKIHQDFSDIERQIDECSIVRHIRGGKKITHIDVIWVVVTGHITNNAQIKIHDKFKARSINFIDGKKLASLIDDYAPSLWTDLPLETSEYLAELKARTIETDKSLTLIPLGDERFYIEPDIYENEELDYTKTRKRPKKVKILNVIENKSVMLIEGGMGSGKSKLVRHLTEHFTNPKIFKKSKFLPITTTYSDLMNHHKGSLNILMENKISEEILKETDDLRNLIFIDGVDERNIPVDKQVEEIERIVSEVEDSSGDITVVITSRYLDGFEHAGELEHKISRYEIKPLTFTKLLAFLTKLCEKLNIKDRIIQDLKKSQLFKELPRTPISAILLAKLLNEDTQDLPSNMTELYSKYIELMLGRWDIDKGLQVQKEYQALDTILQKIAVYMLDNDLTFIAINEAKDFFQKYLEMRNLGINADDLFEIMNRRCEIVVINETRNIFGFKHRTFVEFFYAKSMLDDAEIEVDERIYNLYWINTYFFFLGLKRDCPDLLERIIGQTPESEPEQWMRFINLSSYLLAAYSSPYSVISSGIESAVLEAGQLFRDIVEGKIDSPFSLLSRMHLLYLMQLLVRQSYSYDFFKEGIEESALRINDSEASSSVKAYSLFFLNVAYIDLGGTESFDFLLDPFRGSIPMDLQEAIMHESKKLPRRTTLMKKQDRALKKSLKGNIKLQKKLNDLYNEPINTLIKKIKK